MAESILFALLRIAKRGFSNRVSLSARRLAGESSVGSPCLKGLTMNRVIQFLGQQCPCARAREHVERLAEAARDIEATCGEGLIEICVPTPAMVIEDGRRGVRLFVCQESDELQLDNLVADVAAELRCLADSLNAAADALCAGGAA